MEKLFAGEWLLLGEPAKRHVTHFFQNGINTELDPIIDPIKQQFQVLFGGKKKSESKKLNILL